jgi:dTDP-4-dehydrorhamnose reductase
MSKVLIIGAGGMLGHKLCQLLTDHELVATIRRDPGLYERHPAVFGHVRLIRDVDVLADDALERAIEQEAPDVIVNAVGIIKQLEEASNRYLSVAINAWLPHRLAKLAERGGARLIHISTDCVFDGEDGGYRESDPSNARDLYGQSKFLGETDGAEAHAVTLRTSIVGRELARPGSGLFEWFFSQRGGRVGGFTRAIYTGFTTLEMARVIDLMIKDFPDLRGLWQVASEPIDKHALLSRLNDRFDLEITLDRNDDFRCDRSLNMARFAAATGYVAPSWGEMLDDMHRDPTDYDAL